MLGVVERNSTLELQDSMKGTLII